MSAVKWIAALIFGLAGLGALALAVLQTPRPAPSTFRGSLSPVPMRPMAGAPALPVAVAAAAVPARPEVRESLDAGVARPADKAADAGQKVVDAGVKVVAAAPAPAPRPASPQPAQPVQPPVAAAADGLMNLQASDTADVYVDGRKVGSSPVMGFKAKAGTHKVRFDCYDAAGNAVTGTVKVVTVSAEKDQDVGFTCPEAQ